MILPQFDPPADVPAFQPFWDGIEQRELRLPRCGDRWEWYPEASGTTLPDTALEWQRIAPTGRIYTFTRVHRSFLPGNRGQAPYVVGLISPDGIEPDEHDETGDGGTAHAVHLVANIEDSADLAIGARVEVDFVAVGSRGHPVYRLIGD